jgi:hypothetical protein
VTDPTPFPLLDPDDEPGRALRVCAATDDTVTITQAAAARLTSIHTSTHTVAATPPARVRFTREIPGVPEERLAHLDERGIVRRGTRVAPGDLLVGRVQSSVALDASPAQRPQEEKALEALRARPDGLRDVSLRVPPKARGVVMDVRTWPASRETPASVEIELRDERPLRVGDGLRLAGEPTVRTVGAIVPDLSGDDAAWPGAYGLVRVEKVDCAEDVLEARSIGPYSLVTQQPFAGKAELGGQLVRRASREELARRGAAFVAHEMVTVKCDDVPGRVRAYETIVRGGGEIEAGLPESARVLLAHLEALGFLAEDAVPRPPPSPAAAPIFTLFEPPVPPHDVPLRLRLATSASVRARSRGALETAYTIDEQTFRAVPGGLFCERIFGPVRDYRCACGRLASVKLRGQVCGECGVEVVASKVRRERFGHVELASPVLHPWLFETTATLLGVTVAELGAVLYELQQLGGGEAATVERTGAREIRRALGEIDLARVAREPGPRGELVRTLVAARVDPASFVFDAWPVLPADLRPLVPLDGGRFATSDLNDLTRSIVQRSKRLARLAELAAPVILQHNEAVLLQRDVDALVENGLRRPPVVGPNGRELRSLASMVLGPASYAATALAGKRVDYSGRAAVVARPIARGTALLPREMVRELFRPWTYSRLEAHGHVTTLKAAKALVAAHASVAEEALAEVVRERPVIVIADDDPRALASFEIELWDELVIGLPPEMLDRLVGGVSGATVAVHVPIDDRSVAEARRALSGAPPPTLDAERWPSGWLGALAEGGDRHALVRAVLEHATDPVLDPIARTILGRPPS